MTAPPAGALEACLALLEKATRGRWSQDTGGDITMDDGTTLFTRELPGGDSDVSFANADLVEAAVNLLKDHGPALLAALRLREACEFRIRAWRAGGPNLIEQQHVIYDACADDLARVLEESATGGEAVSPALNC